MYTVASPDPDPRGGGQLPNPNKRNSTLTSETKNIYPHLYIDLGKWVAGFELSMRVDDLSEAAELIIKLKPKAVEMQNSAGASFGSVQGLL